MNELGQKLDTDRNFILMGKIHFHLRLSINLKLNILNRVSNRADHSLYIKNLIVDLLNPVGQMKLKILLNLNQFSLLAS